MSTEDRECLSDRPRFWSNESRISGNSISIRNHFSQWGRIIRIDILGPRSIAEIDFHPIDMAGILEFWDEFILNCPSADNPDECRLYCEMRFGLLLEGYLRKEIELL